MTNLLLKTKTELFKWLSERERERERLRQCNDWSEASGFTCSKMFIEQRQKQTGNGQQAKTGISETEQRRKQYQAGVEVTGTGSEFQGRAVRGQTQRWQEE